MKPWKILAIVALLTTVTLAQSQSPVDGGKAGNGPLLSPYGQIGSPLPKVEEKSTDKKGLDLEAPYLDPDKVPLGAIPRDEVPAPYSRFFFSGEYIGWNLNNTSLNPVFFNVPEGLLQISPTNITLNQNGQVSSVVSVSNLSSLILQSQAQLSQSGVIDYGIQSGTRLSAGIVLDEESGKAITGNFILVPKTSYQLGSNTGISEFPLLLQTGFNNTLNFILPPVVVGDSPTLSTQDYSVVLARQVNSTVFANVNNFLVGGEINARGKDLYMGDMKFSGLLGFRYLQFTENLGVDSQYTIFRPAGVTDVQTFTANNVTTSAPTLLNYPNPIYIQSASSDNIKVYNHFIGPQIGFNSEFKYKRWSVFGTTKLGIGVVHQVARIQSNTTRTSTTELVTVDQNNQFVTTTNTTTTNSQGGLLFSPYDNTKYDRNQFGLLPEINVKLGYDVTDRFKLTVGYDFLLMSNVLRAPQQTQIIPYTNQLNYTANAQQMNMSQSLQIPAFQYNNSNLIINGLNIGAQLDF